MNVGTLENNLPLVSDKLAHIPLKTGGDSRGTHLLIRGEALPTLLSVCRYNIVMAPDRRDRIRTTQYTTKRAEPMYTSVNKWHCHTGLTGTLGVPINDNSVHNLHHPSKILKLRLSCRSWFITSRYLPRPDFLARVLRQQPLFLFTVVRWEPVTPVSPFGMHGIPRSEYSTSEPERNSLTTTGPSRELLSLEYVSTSPYVE